jgi:hypothetical protein
MRAAFDAVDTGTLRLLKLSGTADNPVARHFCRLVHPDYRARLSGDRARPFAFTIMPHRTIEKAIRAVPRAPSLASRSTPRYSAPSIPAPGADEFGMPCPALAVLNLEQTPR